MKLGIARVGGSPDQTTPVRVAEDGSYVPVTFPGSDQSDPWMRWLRDGADHAAVTDAGEPLPGETELDAPLHRPGKIIAIGLNYADHTAETGLEAPAEPLTFAKYSTSIVGPTDTIVVPSHITTSVDWESELAFVVGSTCGPNSPGTLENIAAYTVSNDVSARDLQFSDKQWTRGKSLDTFCPLGPVLVTADEAGTPTGRRIWAKLNDTMMQEATTDDMIFDVPALLTALTACVTLEPGDVVLTGTPPGVGGFRDPAVYMQDGDVIECGVEGIGVLRNPVSHV